MDAASFALFKICSPEASRLLSRRNVFGCCDATPTRTCTQNGRKYRQLEVRVVEANGVTKTDTRVA